LQHQYLHEAGLEHGLRSLAVRILLHYIRGWDQRSAHNVDLFVTNSDRVGQRVRKFYRRDSVRVYPPVDLDGFSVHTPKDDFYFTASRLVPYKRINLIVEAFSRTPRRKLVIIGDGPEFKRIAAIAGPNVQMLGYQPASVLRDHMQRARAFVFAADEDFGIVPLEALACGTPVIALGRGGLLETMIPGQTGLFFNEQTPQSLLEALDEFEALSHWDPLLMRRAAERFSVGRFREEFSNVIESEWNRFQSRGPRPVSEPFPAARISRGAAGASPARNESSQIVV
jgi:glycosyltransferase involved in cell wall biosynthesis